MRKIAAYTVHLFTATGAALGLWSLILINDGFFQRAIWVLAAAALVDSVDGVLARQAGTQKYASRIDGALMDNIIDFCTWTLAPLFWIYATMQIPVWVLLICAVASIFGFTNIEAKTDDKFFTGFPSYWNILVFYIFLLDLPVTLASLILLIFAFSTFLPVKFIYPSRTELLQPLTLALGVMFILQFAALIFFFNHAPRWLVYTSFLFPFYYFGLSFYVNLRTATS